MEEQDIAACSRLLSRLRALVKNCPWGCGLVCHRLESQSWHQHSPSLTACCKTPLSEVLRSFLALQAFKKKKKKKDFQQMSGPVKEQTCCTGDRWSGGSPQKPLELSVLKPATSDMHSAACVGGSGVSEAERLRQEH